MSNDRQKAIRDRLTRFQKLLADRERTNPGESYDDRFRYVSLSENGAAIWGEAELERSELELINKVAGFNASNESEGGRWVTIKGRHVFIKDGQSVEDSIRGTKDADESDENDKKTPSLVTLRDPSGKATSLTISHDGKDWTVKTSSGQILPRKFGSRAEAKQWTEEKVGAEINRRYEAGKAAGTLKQGPNKSDVIDRQDQARKDRELAKKQWDDFNRNH